MRRTRWLSPFLVVTLLLSVAGVGICSNAKVQAAAKLGPQDSSDNVDIKWIEESQPAEEGGPAPDPIVRAEDTSDKTSSSWAEADVDWMLSNQIVPPQLQYNYKQFITREEFAALAVSVLEFMSGSKSKLIYTMSENEFADTTSADVQKAYSFGIVNGVSDTEFKPAAYISRQEAAMMMSNLLQSIQANNLSKAEYDYPDKKSIASWAREAVNVTSNLKLFQGTGQGFQPQGNYTREQAIAVMRRLLAYEGSAQVVSLRGRVVIHLDDLGTEEDAKSGRASPMAVVVGKSSVKFTWTENMRTSDAVLDLFRENDGHSHLGALQISATTWSQLTQSSSPVKAGDFTLQTGVATKPGAGYLLKVTW